ncbi:ATP-binding protein [Haloarcula halophila]|uniref:ATP-binding protein n=1 Tax=Haloarcula TaxID=2237 RepID=UPI0023E451ED|nr:ATP-binding protein [Halomicroarcula sp. DFY41]
MYPDVTRRLSPTGLVVAVLGFLLTRFTVTLAAADAPMQFVLAGIAPLLLGLGLSAFGIALTVGEFEPRFVRTVTLWCLAGTASMFVLVALTLVGNDGMAEMASVQSRTYLSNFLIGGGVGGALTGVYAGRANRQQRDLQQQAARLDMVNRILRDRVLNALTVIRGRSEVAKNREDVPPEQTFGVISERSDAVRTTVENVKHITWHGRAESPLEPVAVAPAVERALERVRSDYPDAAYDRSLDVASDVTVAANTLLTDLVAHLIENGVVYSDAATPRVSVSLSATAETVTLTVADNGPGLPERQRDLLDRGVIGQYDDRSTGFGLDLVRLLADSYGGTTDATVSEDETTIELRLPRVSEADDHPDLVEETVYGIPPRRLAIAVGASLLAGVVMGVPLQLLAGSVPVIGALYGVTDIWVGWITHEFHSIVFGLVYGALVTALPVEDDPLRYVGVAVAWALVLWLFAAGLVMPLWLGLLGFTASLPSLSMMSLFGHLVWGVSLGGAYWLGTR